MVYKIVKSDELYHHGIKGMKWGVRKEKYTKDQIQKRRSELIAQAPKSDGKRRSASSPPTKGYWKNASDGQIRRLMEQEARDRRRKDKLDAKEAKKEYKQEKKNIREASNKIFKEYVDTQKASSQAYVDYKKSQKAELKGKSIDKDTYRENVRKAKDNMRQINNRAEVKMVVGQYHIQKRRHANDMVYAIDTRNSKAYEKGKKAFYRDTEYTTWGNSTYRITKRKDGTYNIGRTDYYYY